jgi:hypothetical protein
LGEEQVLLLDTSIMDDCGSVPGRGKDLSLCNHIQASSGAYPTSSPSVLEALSEAVKWLENELDHSSSFSGKQPLHFSTCFHGMFLN